MAEPPTSRRIEIATARGPALALVDLPPQSTSPPSTSPPSTSPPSTSIRGLVVLGHGAGGGCEAPDLQALRRITAHGWALALVDQPWRVAGRRLAGPAAHLDDAWREVLPALRNDLSDQVGAGTPVVVGGRSTGARVACRTAAEVSAAAVLCLAFPLHPPGRPERSRIEELTRPLAAGLPVLVVQGKRDRFGDPDQIASALRRCPPTPQDAVIAAVPGDHMLTSDPSAVVSAVIDWLKGLPLTPDL